VSKHLMQCKLTTNAMVAVDTVITVNGIFDRPEQFWVSVSHWHESVLEAEASVKPARCARPFGLRGLTPASASNRGPP